MSRSTSRSVRYSRLPLPTVTFTEVGADFRSRDFSTEIALPPVRTVTNRGGVTDIKGTIEVRARSKALFLPDVELSVVDARKWGGP
jgi:hypothetical protein